MQHYSSTARKAFEIVNGILMVFFCVTIILPFINLLAISFSGYDAASKGQVSFLPKDFTLANYKLIVFNLHFIRCFCNSTFLTLVITTLQITTCITIGYVLANKHMIMKKTLMNYFLIPMYFSGGLIPVYILVANTLKLNNSWFALILPALVSPFYVIIFRNSIRQIPLDLPESAEIDGAGEVTILFRIMMPLIKPMIAAFAIMTAVSVWNEWFGTMIYLRDRNKWSLNYKLREIYTNLDLAEDENSPFNAIVRLFREKTYSESVKSAALLVSILPIVAIYPYMQRYFIHGVIVGAVKG